MSERLNRKLIDDLRLLMEEDFPVLLETFLAESERQFRAIGDAWAQRDLDALRRSAHSLKGSGSNIGAEELARLCADLEQRARSEGDSIADAIDRVGAEVDAVRDDVRSICGAA